MTSPFRLLEVSSGTSETHFYKLKSAEVRHFRIRICQVINFFKAKYHVLVYNYGFGVFWGLGAEQHRECTWICGDSHCWGKLFILICQKNMGRDFCCKRHVLDNRSKIKIKFQLGKLLFACPSLKAATHHGFTRILHSMTCCFDNVTQKNINKDMKNAGDFRQRTCLLKKKKL